MQPTTPKSGVVPLKRPFGRLPVTHSSASTTAEKNRASKASGGRPGRACCPNCAALAFARPSTTASVSGSARTAAEPASKVAGTAEGALVHEACGRLPDQVDSRERFAGWGDGGIEFGAAAAGGDGREKPRGRRRPSGAAQRGVAGGIAANFLRRVAARPTRPTVNSARLAGSGTVGGVPGGGHIENKLGAGGRRIAGDIDDNVRRRQQF